MSGSEVVGLKPAELNRVFRAYGLSGATVESVAAGYRNVAYLLVDASGRRYCLLLHKQEVDAAARIRRINDLGLGLNEAGLPVRYPADRRILCLRSAQVRRYVSLQVYLPGFTIPWETYSMKHIKLLGWAMAALHGAMRHMPAGAFPSVVGEYETVLARMQSYFSEFSVQQSLADKLSIVVPKTSLQRLKHFLIASRILDGQQLLHMDFVRGNVLFRPANAADTFTIGEVSLSGILDFEKAAIGHPMFDIARTLSFLLVDCSSKSEAQIRKYFLRSGYEKRGQSQAKKLSINGANGEEYDVLETAIDLHILYDVYKFLRANPYESLVENYHFIRTKELALRRGLIH